MNTPPYPPSPAFFCWLLRKSEKGQAQDHGILVGGVGDRHLYVGRTRGSGAKWRSRLAQQVEGSHNAAIVQLEGTVVYQPVRQPAWQN